MSTIRRLLACGALAAFALPLLPPPPLATNQDCVPTGEARPVTTEDFRPRTSLSSAHSEIWSYVLLLDDGMLAAFSLSQANLGRIMGSVSGAEFSISGFGGRTYRAPKEYDAVDLVFTERNHRLQVHPDIFAEGRLPDRHRIRFKTIKHDLPYDVDLTFSDIAGGFTWGDGVFCLGSEQIGMFIHIPIAHVSGTISIDGTTKHVSGTAYMDHTFQTHFAPRLIRGAYRYIQHGATPEVGYLVRPAERYGDGVIGFGGVRRRGQFVLNAPKRLDIISTRPSQDVEVPRQLSIHFEGGRQTILNRSRDQQSFSVLDELRGLQRSVARRYLGGEAVVFRGLGTTNLREPVAYEYVIIR